MYVYGFYKSSGLDGVTSTFNSDTRIAEQEKSNRDLTSLLLWDLGRSDIQAYILYKLNASDRNYDLSYGRTYLASASILIPKYILPVKPPSKVKEGTEIQYGKGSFEPNISQSSRVYGLSGEAMLNFGVFAVPVFLAFFGLLVNVLRRWILHLKDDSRLLLVPFVAIACFNIISSDSSHIIFFIFKQGLIPFISLLLGSKIISMSKRRH
jgi:hypothetical protein